MAPIEAEPRRKVHAASAEIFRDRKTLAALVRRQQVHRVKERSRVDAAIVKARANLVARDPDVAQQDRGHPEYALRPRRLGLQENLAGRGQRRQLLGIPETKPSLLIEKAQQ